MTKTQNLSVLQRAERKRSNLLLIETVVTLASQTSLLSPSATLWIISNCLPKWVSVRVLRESVEE